MWMVGLQTDASVTSSTWRTDTPARHISTKVSTTEESLRRWRKTDVYTYVGNDPLDHAVPTRNQTADGEQATFAATGASIALAHAQREIGYDSPSGAIHFKLRNKPRHGPIPAARSDDSKRYLWHFATN